MLYATRVTSLASGEVSGRHSMWRTQVCTLKLGAVPTCFSVHQITLALKPSCLWVHKKGRETSLSVHSPFTLCPTSLVCAEQGCLLRQIASGPWLSGRNNARDQTPEYGTGQAGPSHRATSPALVPVIGVHHIRVLQVHQLV